VEAAVSSWMVLSNCYSMPCSIWPHCRRNYNEKRSMETLNLESISIAVGREEDGRWWADIESMPGVMTYGPTREAAIAAVRALALRVAADCIDHGEDVPLPFAKLFSVT
jgi:predicted RNase H-like HicB family nuclease